MASRIAMVDLKGQYLKIKDEVDEAISGVIDTTSFINGPAVKAFQADLSRYMGGCHVIPCANGTDALQIALMALDLCPGDEVIVPAFTYVASAEVIGLLGLTPVMVDVDTESFNIDVSSLEAALSPRTKAVIPVHLFGQSCDMAPIMEFAAAHNLYVIEDNAQAIGAMYTFPDGTMSRTGTIGHIGCTSFFPSKNLGCYGDGGAMMTRDADLEEKLRCIANHGQKVKYHHSMLGCNSRLDSIQAAVLGVKLKHLDEYASARQAAAAYYSKCFLEIDPQERFFSVPARMPYSTHVWHQYTLKIKGGRRDSLKEFLMERGIPSMIYYPLPLQEQEAFKPITRRAGSLENAALCASSVLSLPIHTEMTREIQDEVIAAVKEFFR